MEMIQFSQITELTTPNITDKLGEAVEDFLTFKALQLRPKSVKTYTESLNQLLLYFGSDQPVTGISSRELTAWVYSLDRTPSGVYMCWQTADFFFRWYYAADPARNPMTAIRLKRPKRDPIKNYFPLPNEIFLLGLSPGELAVYSYLMRCEDRRTHQCHPAYKTIGRAVHLSPNTVAKHVNSLREKH